MYTTLKKPVFIAEALLTWSCSVSFFSSHFGNVLNICQKSVLKTEQVLKLKTGSKWETKKFNFLAHVDKP